MSKDGYIYDTKELDISGCVPSGAIELISNSEAEAIKEGWIGLSVSITKTDWGEVVCELDGQRPMTAAELKNESDQNLRMKKNRRMEYDQLKKEFEGEENAD